MPKGLLARLVAALVASCTAAAAESPSPTPAYLAGGQVYVSLGGIALVGRYSRFNALNEALTPAFATQLDVAPSAVSAGPSGSIGVVLYEAPTSMLLRRVRVDFGGEYRAGASRDSAPPYSIPTAFGPAALLAFLSIDGRQGLLFGSTPFEDGVARLRTEDRALAGAVRLRAELAAGPLVATPFIGFVAEESRQRYTLDFHLSGTGTRFDYNIDERVRTRRLGGEAGADLALRVGEALTLHGGGSFAYFRQRTRFAGDDCFTASTIAAGSPCGAWATSVAYADARMAWRTDLWLGVTAETERVRFTLMGLGRYDSVVPGVRNPVATEAIFLGGAARPGPAAIRYAGQWSYGGMLRATFALP